MNEDANVNNIKRLQEKALLWRMVSLQFYTHSGKEKFFDHMR